jgi:hypothetical protein
MTEAAQIAASVCAAVNLAAGIVGGWAWWRGTSGAAGRAFWPLCRAGQAAAGVLAVLAGVAVVTGYDPPSSLVYLYLMLPIIVSVIAEQLRFASAQTILDQRGLENAQAMEVLSEAEQRSIVLAIVGREIGVLALSGFVIAFLALRVLGTV